MKLNNYIKSKAEVLKKHNIDNPILEVRYIINEELDLSLEEQIFNKDITLTLEQKKKIRKNI